MKPIYLILTPPLSALAQVAGQVAEEPAPTNPTELSRNEQFEFRGNIDRASVDLIE